MLILAGLNKFRCWDDELQNNTSATLFAYSWPEERKGRGVAVKGDRAV